MKFIMLPYSELKEAPRSQREDVQILIHTRGGRIRLCSEKSGKLLSL